MDTGRYPNKLRTYRHCMGYSQKKVASMLGLSDTSVISRWEHGSCLPNIMQVFRLSKIYETLPHVLFEHLWNHTDATDRLLTPKESIISHEACAYE